MIELKDLEIGKVIGKGSFGTVNRGKWKGKDVAVKRMKTAGYVSMTQDLSNHKEISILRLGYSYVH